ncbi:hypothetical protein IDJ77_14220 [Mucilaginibacter sp. ZT4R22]|uniref:DUF4369 domain-containing protein n=1 Tax=Mucilaginibacter pankratovii TaxID=2772110 RepID=A0ABR7WRN6_9SPHI|nr:hypothetical protein [Mucilaginibacter pankratovii]MBD1364973.1 hypothetical protein [Mucilaginibacter pankratovii]
MKLLYLTVATLLLLSSLAVAQTHFEPGYAVTLKGDTLYGTIDSRDLHGNPRQVKFNTAAGNNAMVLTPNNTQYLEVKGRQAYQRYAGFITLDHISEQQVLNERDTSMRLDTVFLKVLQKGEKLSLYSFSDHIKNRFYITEKDGEMPVELGYRLYYDSGKVNVYTGKGRTVSEDTYMTQLYNIALKHDLMTPDIQHKIEWLRYTKSYILEVVNKINGVKK